jgi:hypothetical protein
MPPIASFSRPRVACSTSAITSSSANVLDLGIVKGKTAQAFRGAPAVMAEQQTSRLRAPDTNPDADRLPATSGIWSPLTRAQPALIIAEEVALANLLPGLTLELHQPCQHAHADDRAGDKPRRSRRPRCG